MVTDLNRRLMAKVFVAFVFSEFRRFQHRTYFLLPAGVPVDMLRAAFCIQDDLVPASGNNDSRKHRYGATRTTSTR
jgi:hypothetical protein